MDTLKILLAATVALLVGALAVALNKNGGSGKDEEKTEIAKINLEIEKLRMERENLEQQRQLQNLRDANRVAVAPAPAPAISDQAAMDKIRELEAQNAALEASNAKAERKVDVLDKEAAYMSGAGAAILSGHDKSERRARQISNAMLMATVKEWHDDDLGGFAVINIVEASTVQVGTVLSVRRKSGILGKLRVEKIEADGVIASASTAFPGPKPDAGDDLILDPEE